MLHDYSLDECLLFYLYNGGYRSDYTCHVFLWRLEIIINLLSFSVSSTWKCMRQNGCRPVGKTGSLDRRTASLCIMPVVVSLISCLLSFSVQAIHIWCLLCKREVRLTPEGQCPQCDSDLTHYLIEDWSTLSLSSDVIRAGNRRVDNEGEQNEPESTSCTPCVVGLSHTDPLNRPFSMS